MIYYRGSRLRRYPPYNFMRGKYQSWWGFLYLLKFDIIEDSLLDGR